MVPPFNEMTKLLYGEPKIGKTFFMAGDPDNLFIATEPGHDYVKTGVIHIGRWDANSPGETDKPCFVDVIRDLWVQRNNGTLEYTTVTIDIVDNLWDMCVNHGAALNGFNHPGEDKRMGTTWAACTKEWKIQLQRLMGIMNVVFISHMHDEDVESVGADNITRQWVKHCPKFRGNKASQFLDGVVNCIGFVYRHQSGERVITFEGNNPSLATGDRSGILESCGIMKNNFPDVETLYTQKCKELGLTIKSKWS